MKIVIDIPEALYEECKRLGDKRDTLFEAIRNATPLTDCTDVISREEALKLKTRIDKYGDMIYAFDVNRLPSVNPTTDLSKIRAEIEKPIWIEYSIKGTSQNEILELVNEVMRKMKIEVIKIIDKYSKGGDSDV